MQSDQNHAEIVLALDVGGTFIKSALFRSGEMQQLLPQIPSCSSGSVEEIASALREATRGEFDAIGVAIPGPFDYRSGTSLMTHKFGALKGRSLREFLPDVPVRFLHDANAFLLGEWDGRSRMGGITLGTGIGAAVIADGELLNNELGSPREDVSLWNKPFRGSTVETALEFRKHDKALADAARSGDVNAGKTWFDFGLLLAEILTEWNRKHRFEEIVLGGQIANDFDLFRKPLAGLPIRRAKDKNAALIGAAQSCKGLM